MNLVRQSCRLEIYDIAVRVWSCRPWLVLHCHVAIRCDEITLGDNVCYCKFRWLNIHRCHPLTDGVLACDGLFADDGPNDVVRAERKNPTTLPSAKEALTFSTASLFLADM